MSKFTLIHWKHEQLIEFLNFQFSNQITYVYYHNLWKKIR